MEAQHDIADAQLLAVRQRLDDNAWLQTLAQQRAAGRGAQISSTAGPRVITMRVRDDCTIDRAPRIDVKAAAWTEQPIRSLAKHADDFTRGHASLAHGRSWTPRFSHRVPGADADG